MVALRCTEKSTPSSLARAIWASRKTAVGDAQHGGVDHLVGQDGDGRPKLVMVPSEATSSTDRLVSAHHRRPLGRAEVADGHVGHVGARLR